MRTTSSPTPSSPAVPRTARLHPNTGRLLAALALLVGLVAFPARASAFGGMPLQSLSVQLHDRHVELFAEHWEPGLLTPGGLARLLARALDTTPSLDVIHWTVEADATAEHVASLWGLPLATLLSLNAELDLTAQTPLAAGTRLVVYRADPEQPSRSIGRPNRGSLRNGMPFPEGPDWTLRTVRRRQYASELSVRTLMTAITRYRQIHPDGPPVRIGELSKRTGNRIPPHASHRSGRDADLGYIGLDPELGTEFWTKVTGNDNLDAEKTWTFIKAMLDTGNVDSIFIDRTIQPRLAEVAARELSREEVRALFAYPRHAESHRAVIQHWPGHKSHLHVRFSCAPGNWRCR